MNPSYYDETVPPFARFFGRSLRENQLCEDCIKFPFEVFFLKEPAPLDPQIVFRRLDSVKANSRTCPFCRLLHRAAFTFAYREFTRQNDQKTSKSQQIAFSHQASSTSYEERRMLWKAIMMRYTPASCLLL